MNLIFATNNPHKLTEIRSLLGDSFSILSLQDIDCTDEIPETRNTLEGNASQKAFYIYNYLRAISEGSPSPWGGQGRGCWGCFADDTGLEIEALDDRPGVFSARYAGPDCNFEDNISKALKELQGITNRKARFRTVISLIINGEEKLFEGIVNGKILTGKRGDGGFGYDPIFQPNGYGVSFAEMSMEEKNNISHRGKAVKKLVEYLNDLFLD